MPVDVCGVPALGISEANITMLAIIHD